jgi:hypothetical protein
MFCKLRQLSPLFGLLSQEHALTELQRRLCQVSTATPRSENVTSPILRPLEISLPQSASDLIPPLESRQPTRDSVRTGLIAVKVGMVSEWDEYGVLTPFTVLWFDENQV